MTTNQEVRSQVSPPAQPIEPGILALLGVELLETLGGEGSGNFGHAGRPGEVGGSGSGSWPLDNDALRTEEANDLSTTFVAGIDWAEKLTSAEKDAVSDYTNQDHRPINRYLRTGEQQGTREFEQYQDYARRRSGLIDKAIQKATPPPPPAIVWRGVDMQTLDRLVGGDVVRLDGFQSATLDPHIADGWDWGVLEIVPKAGALAWIVSNNADEKEFLLPHGRQYRVRGVTMVPFGPGTRRRKVVQLEML
jgi:hypothetical protein